MNKENFAVALLFFVTFAILTISQTATAAVVVRPTVDGYASGTFRPISTPSVSGSQFSTVGRLTVSGKPVVIPASVPPAANAASFAKSALW